VKKFSQFNSKKRKTWKFFKIIFLLIFFEEKDEKNFFWKNLWKFHFISGCKNDMVCEISRCLYKIFFLRKKKKSCLEIFFSKIKPSSSLQRKKSFEILIEKDQTRILSFCRVSSFYLNPLRFFHRIFPHKTLFFHLTAIKFSKDLTI